MGFGVGYNMLEDYHKRFLERHDFNDNDLEVLRTKYSDIKIYSSVPTAWILIIDSFLEKTAHLIKEVRQEYGQFVVIPKQNINSKDFILYREQLKKADKLILEMDKDLAEELK